MTGRERPNISACQHRQQSAKSCLSLVAAMCRDLKLSSLKSGRGSSMRLLRRGLKQAASILDGPIPSI